MFVFWMQWHTVQTYTHSSERIFHLWYGGGRIRKAVRAGFWQRCLFRISEKKTTQWQLTESTTGSSPINHAVLKFHFGFVKIVGFLFTWNYRTALVSGLWSPFSQSHHTTYPKKCMTYVFPKNVTNKIVPCIWLSSCTHVMKWHFTHTCHTRSSSQRAGLDNQ